MESYFTIEDREDGKFLIEKELTIKEEKLLEEDSESQLNVQIEELEEKLSRLFSVKKAFEVMKSKEEVIEEDIVEIETVEESEETVEE